MKAFFSVETQKYHFGNNHPGDDFVEVDSDVIQLIEDRLADARPTAEPMTLERAKSRIVTIKAFCNYPQCLIIVDVPEGFSENLSKATI